MGKMFHPNLGLKDYIKNGTLFSSRKTWEARSLTWLATFLVIGNTNAQTGCARHVGGHLTQCEAYKDLRGDHDLEIQEELVEFFMKVMNRRKEKNWAMMRDRCTATQQEPSCSSQIVLVMLI